MLDTGENQFAELESGAIEEITQALLLREQALVSSSNGIMITRSDAHDHSIVYVNPAFERITGYSAQEVIGLEGRFLVRDDIEQADLEEIRNALREHRPGRALLRNYRKDGSQFWNELHIAPVKDAQGVVTTHFVSVINDVSERLQYQRELEYQARHDSLTGLLNRDYLQESLSAAIKEAKKYHHQCAVLLLDLDHFKLVNEASGHGTGDEMLKQIGRRLKQCVTTQDAVARLGGDEFALLLVNLEDGRDITRIVERIREALSHPLRIHGQDVFISASIGISMYPRDGDHAEILLRYADIAMYRVKEAGRNGYMQFMPEMGKHSMSRLAMVHALRRGIEQGEFRLHYQPKISLSSGKVIGAEALLRWRHAEIGMIPPLEFIPLAEESGLILPLGDWVLAEACRQQARWRKQGLGEMNMAVNMSSRQFRQKNLVRKVFEIIQETGADPRSITLELTESMVMQDVTSTSQTLHALKKLGLSISLDDFGTGYSSLSYLRRLPIDELKIDKSFINDIHTNPDDTAIARAVIAMGLNLGLDIVAEGVEHGAQSEILQQLGCIQVQGYHFAKPMPGEDFAQYLRSTQFVASLG